MKMKNDSLTKYFPLITSYINPVVIFLWRLGLGKLLNLCPSVTGHLMILKQTGRKTGNPVLTPVNFIEIEGRIFCAASLGESSDWYLNIVSDPQVELWLPDGWYTGQAGLVDQQDERLEILRLVLSSGNIFFRLIGIDPKIDDVQFEQEAESYKLIFIDRKSARTGANGPGSLAWIWPFILIFLLGLRTKKRR